MRLFAKRDPDYWFGTHKHGSLAKAGMWSALTINSGSVIQIGTAIVMARLLPPEDFGTVAIVMVMYNLLSGLTGMALSNAAVQKHDLTIQQASNFFWVNVGLSSIFGALVALAGPFLAHFYGQPELKWLGLIYGLLLVLDGSAIAHRGLIVRAMRFDFSFWNGLLLAPVGVGAAVGLALLGAGPYAIVAQAVCGGIAGRLSLFLFIRWRPAFYQRGAGIRSMLRFGGRSAFAMFIDFIYRQGQVFALGKYASVADAGFYNRGQALFQRPFGQIMGPMMQVFLPTLSARQNDPAAVDRFILKASWLLGLGLLPMLVFVSLFGASVASVVLGSEWRPAGDAMSWFALGAFPWVLMAPLAKAVEAMGFPAKAISVRIALLPVFIAGTIWAAPQGAAAIVMVYAVIQWIGFLPTLWIAFYGLALSARENLLTMLRLTVLSGVLSVALSLFLPLLRERFAAGQIEALAAMAGAGLAAYLVFLILACAFRDGRAVAAEVFLRILRASRPKGLAPTG